MHNTAPILIAVEDSAVHSEAIHLAAAAGRPILDAGADPTAVNRYFDTAHAVLFDARAAQKHRTHHRHSGVFLVGADPESIESELEMSPLAQEAFVLPAQAADLLRALGKLTQQPRGRGGIGTVIAVIGAAGGVGASTLGASISRLAASSHSTTLVDAHRYSGGIDLLLGLEESPGARWGDIDIGEGAVDREDLRRALPATTDGIAVLSSSRTTIHDPFVLDSTILAKTIGVLASAGITVVDCPPHLVPTSCDIALVVTPGEVRATAAAARLVAELATTRTPTMIVVRRRAWSGLDADEIARVTKAPVLTDIPHIPQLTKAVETTGLPTRLPKPLVKAAQKVLDEVKR